jgi:spermidine synthase
MPDQIDTSAEPGATAAPAPPRGGLLWRHVPHAIFFFSCACIMVVELVASRLIASHLGSSLYTWTAVIGVMLAGITAGNVVGGRLADRRRPETTLVWLFLAASAACLAALGLNAVVAATRPLRGLAWPLQILLSVAAIFLLPAVALGTISPSLAKVAIGRARRVGRTLGAFYACGTLGSLAGTFLTGFWLIFVLGHTIAIGAAAGMLAVLGAVSLLLARLKPCPTGEGGPCPTGEGELAGLKPCPTGEKEPCPTGDGGALFWPYTPHAVVFLTAVCLMIVELLASRMIAAQAGSSLYTWTSVIGVVLAGMSLGHIIGGALSDRLDPARLLGWLFVAASASTASVLVLNHLFSTHEPFAGWHWPALVFTTVLCTFFVPSVLLGTFAPVATKVAVQRATRVGTAFGSVSAWNAAGSILGTVASGFWLISALGTRSLAMVVAVLLALAGIALGPRRRFKAAWAALVVAGLVLTRVSVPQLADWKYAGVFQDEPAVFHADSVYQYIRIYEEAGQDVDHTVRVVALDYLVHGYVDLKDPAYLNYGYERVYRDIGARYAGDRTRVSAFFLGGGSYTFPRWLLKQWPGSEAMVAEIDPMVLEANHRATGLSRTTPIRTVLMDARNAVEDLPSGRRFDFVFGDAFNDLAVPYHLTTLEFSRKVASHLRPGGAYLVNVIDNFDSGLLLGAFVNTLQRVFAHVYVFCTEPAGVNRRRDTFVVAASNVPLDTTGWEPNHGTDFEGSLLTAANLAELRQKSAGRILTDDNAPVENLLAPVVRQRTRADK